MSPFALFESLPGETFIHLLLFLLPKEIRKCQRICRLFRNQIKSSARLQYLLELDSLGYSAPVHPRSDLTYNEKIGFLRQAIDPSEQWLNLPYGKELGDSQAFMVNSQFTRGVFAQVVPNFQKIREINVYRLPSRNTNTGYESWHLSDLGVDPLQFKIDPDLDLLVLLETDIPQVSTGPSIQRIRRFHLRSLQTGLPHPLAEVPVIASIDRSDLMFPSHSFQIVGQYITLLCSDAFLVSTCAWISVWDWTTGILVTHADVPGISFAYITPTCFVVHCNRRQWEQKTIGSLEVYTFDPSTPGRPAQHIASLHLPTTPETSCFTTSNFSFSPLSPLSYESREFTPPTLLLRVYELSPSSCYLCLKIRAVDIERRPIANGTLLINAGHIFKVVSGLSEREPRTNIPWENWGPSTFWLNNAEVDSNMNCVAGQRATFGRRDENNDAVQLLMYDLGPSTRNRVEDPHNAMVLLQASAGADLSYLERVFVSERGARRPQLVSLATVPHVGGPGELGTFAMDDEHVIIHLQSVFRASENKLYVYTF
ncbi:hypothetical protein FRC12_000324 [Ceratobasidium sp. 428]|nr:hypothetical protein FRC12_000324 [Ceratobasidium sp. 428]